MYPYQIHMWYKFGENRTNNKRQNAFLAHLVSLCHHAVSVVVVCRNFFHKNRARFLTAEVINPKLHAHIFLKQISRRSGSRGHHQGDKTENL